MNPFEETNTVHVSEKFLADLQKDNPFIDEDSAKRIEFIGLDNYNEAIREGVKHSNQTIDNESSWYNEPVQFLVVSQMKTSNNTNGVAIKIWFSSPSRNISATWLEKNKAALSKFDSGIIESGTWQMFPKSMINNNTSYDNPTENKLMQQYFTEQAIVKATAIKKRNLLSQSFL